jgi:oxygen-independent coproporphyrinogen-3 oxidase
LQFSFLHPDWFAKRFYGCFTKEIKLRQSYLQQETVETIYFGGGSPSILSVSAIHMLDSVFRHFNISPNPEITLEANPDDMEPDRIRAWKQTGIN